MPATAADVIIAQTLASVLGGAWIYNGANANIFTGPVRPQGNGIPHQAIFCLSTGGPAPAPYFGGQSAQKYSRIRVQVRVRGNPGVFDVAGDGVELARSVASALDRPTLAGYIACLLQQSEPVYLGQDRQEHHEWSVNVELWLVQ